MSPGPGFMRLNLGAMLPAANSQPPKETGPISAASSKVISTGCTARIAILPECSRYRPMAPGLNSTSRGREKLSSHQLHQVQRQATAVNQQATGAGQHDGQGVELFGAGDLALFPGVLFTFLRGVFCFVLTTLALGHGSARPCQIT